MPKTYAKGMEEITRWGHWIVTHDVVFDGDTPVECHKDITVNPGASLSAQLHWGRGETYEGLEGVTKVYVNGKIFEIGEGDTVEIPRGSIHFSWNESGEQSKFHEIQVGPLCDELDIKRCADKYKFPDELDSDRDIVNMMIQIAKDRYETKDIAAGFHDNDFMPDVLEIMKGFDYNFDNGDAVEVLSSFFESMVEDAKTQHMTLTPDLPQILAKAAPKA